MIAKHNEHATYGLVFMFRFYLVGLKSLLLLGESYKEEGFAIAPGYVKVTLAQNKMRQECTFSYLVRFDVKSYVTCSTLANYT